MPTLEKTSITLKKLCKELSISTATARNWIRLGKLTPKSFEDGIALFDDDYVEHLKSELLNENSQKLKTRRNKTFSSGTKFYDAYVSKNSPNILTIHGISDYFIQNDIIPPVELVQLLLADCAIKLISKKNNLNENLKSFLFEGEFSDEFNWLINDLLPDEKYFYLIDKYESLFKYEYTYCVNEDTLGLIYISCRNLKNRKENGAYYTPEKTVKKLIENLDNIKLGQTVFDPCCGCGNFLIHLPECVKLDDIYANDIDLLSVQITRLNLAIKYNSPDKNILYKNITCSDYLTTYKDIKYDYIIGNPPWGAKYDEKTKNYINKNYRCAKKDKFESYDVITEKALSNLKTDGYLSFVLPEAILNVKSHKPVRDIICENNSVEYLEYLNEAFNGVQCPSVILKIKNTQRVFDGRNVTVNDGIRTYKTTYKKTDNLLYFVTDEEYAIIQKISGNKNNRIFLKNNAKFALGIVTGNNKDLIKSSPFDGSEIILAGKNLTKYKASAPYNYIKFEPDKFQQIAPIELYRAKEKLIYKFISNEPVFAYDNKKTLTLNSCNILIPNIEGYNIKYILAILNSKIISFYFKKVFKSVKLLRSHIENLPIPVATSEQQNEIINYSDILITKYDQNIYEILDEKIAKLYSLEKDEYYKIIKK